MRKHVLVITVTIMASLSTWLLLAINWHDAKETDVTRENFQRIQIGMTAEDVCALLSTSGRAGRCSEMLCPHEWIGNGNRILIHFDQKTGKAVELFFTGVDGAELRRP